MNAKRFAVLAMAGIGLAFASGSGGYWIAQQRASTQTFADTTSLQAKANKPLYYRNPMGLPDTSSVPKNDSMGMAYIPVYEGEGPDDSGTVRVNPSKVQILGVRTEPVEKRVITRNVAAVGTIQLDERGMAVVSPKFEGWIEQLPVNTTGQVVMRGQVLAEIYSPDIVAAEQEFLVARDAAGHLGGVDETTRKSSEMLVEAASARMRNWDVPQTLIEQIARSSKTMRRLPLVAPSSGIVLDKPAVKGMRFAPGDVLFRIADLSKVWVIADVFEQDMASITIGAKTLVKVDAYPGKAFSGTVSFIYPSVTRETRTAKVRIELPNPELLLRADMYAHVEITSMGDNDPVTVVPDSAIIDSGRRQLVLIEEGEGRYRPQAVMLGRKGDHYTEIVDGVTQGDRVVVTANFLIDSESNLRAALTSFTKAPEAAR